jgi:hypothetical protein
MAFQFRRTTITTGGALPSVACYLSAAAVLVGLVLRGVVAWAAIIWPALGCGLPGLIF